ncbi:hypothetical protein GOP47_0012343 [Adiantum capillus-veneris]|uniref:K+ potassium transporter integral membrane domain-containing protein n=1 Tax=Adiantum capillus-veneris TaxID=13818 RepID=A0A9D4URJ6_ADICA|nr:hypothetical protein GOP47_0012343 [Adiantum capillus-veneris]
MALNGQSNTFMLAYQALGMVYGGLSITPLYLFSSLPFQAVTEDDYLGLLSIIFWTFTLIGGVKYALIVLYADHNGEGGTFALYTLLCKHLNMSPSTRSQPQDNHSSIVSRLSLWAGKSPMMNRFLFGMTMLATCMVIGDGILTPAVSVLSAVEGLKIVSPTFSQGAEAMFADLGHFKRQSIQLGFLLVVYPSNVITYAGLAAYLINNPKHQGQAFFRSTPTFIFWPMFIVSTLAAIVASQGLILACFSLVKQCVNLDCFPQVQIIHTSEKHRGQVYSPQVNYTLMILCIMVVLGFHDGSCLGNAYGVAVILVMLATTVMFTMVMVVVWRINALIALLFFLLFASMELFNLIAMLTKVPKE